MLKSAVQKLICPSCRSAKSLKETVFSEGLNAHIENGVLSCTKCEVWYPIEGELLELTVGDLVYKEDRQKFHSRFSKEFDKYEIPNKSETDQGNSPDQLKQRDHYDDFANNEKLSYDDFENLPFWKASDKIVMSSWSKQDITSDKWVLDVGCGNGRSSVRFFDSDMNLLGLDVSKNMLRKAIKRVRDTPFHKTRTFIVADANGIPVIDSSFDYAVTSGVLSNLPDVSQTCAHINRTLSKKGIYFGLENNRSMFRGIFDALAGIFAPWKNEKGNTPEVNQNMLEGFHNGLNVNVSSISSVFLPPIIFNMLGDKLAFSFLKLTNNIFYTLGLKNHGGLIIFEIQKND